MATNKVKQFRALHAAAPPLLLPNPWDAGSAKLLASLGFDALATTSAGFANTLGRADGNVSRDEAIAHSATVVAAVDVPVSADLENGFADDPAGVAETVRLAIEAGLAGCSIEDYSGTEIYPHEVAVDRIRAAVDAARGELVLTARAENHIRRNPDLADTVARLQAFQEAGADVLYAPGLTDIADIRSVVSSVDRPVNVLAIPGAPTVAELADAGVKRISVGSGFALVAYGGVIDAARELLDEGTYDFWQQGTKGAIAAGAAFS